MNELTCGCQYVDSLILGFCEQHKYPGPESHKDGKGVIIRDLEAQIHELTDALERARTYTGVEAQGCPLCTYVDGVFKESCSFHQQIRDLTEVCNRLMRPNMDPISGPRPYSRNQDLEFARTVLVKMTTKIGPVCGTCGWHHTGNCLPKGGP